MEILVLLYLIYQKHRHASWAMGSKHQGLLNICCFGRACDKSAKTRVSGTQNLISFVHVPYYGVFTYHQGKMLTDKRKDSLHHPVFREP